MSYINFTNCLVQWRNGIYLICLLTKEDNVERSLKVLCVPYTDDSKDESSKMGETNISNQYLSASEKETRGKMGKKETKKW